MTKMSKREAGLLGSIIAAKRKKERSIANYYNDPNYCLECGSLIELREGEKPFQARRKKFCSHSCAGTHSNKNRERKPWSNEARDVASQQMQKVWEERQLTKGEDRITAKKTWYQKYSDSPTGNCKQCGTLIDF